MRMLVLLLATFGAVAFAPAPSRKEVCRPLPQQIVKAWCDAGAKTGWMRALPPELSGGYQFWEPFRDKVEAGSVPAFRFHPKSTDVLAKLPDPGVPFGLDFHCSGVDGPWLKKLSHLRSLRSLNVGGSLALKDSALRELAALKGLHALYLFYTPITDVGLKQLGGLKGLRALDISHTLVTDAGLKSLAEIKHLRGLNLGNTRVTDAGLKRLAGMKELRCLNLRRTKVTAVGIAALQKALPDCKIESKEDE